MYVRREWESRGRRSSQATPTTTQRAERYGRMASGRMLERRSVESDQGRQPGRFEYGFESSSILERKPIAAVRE